MSTDPVPAPAPDLARTIDNLAGRIAAELLHGDGETVRLTGDEAGQVLAALRTCERLLAGLTQHQERTAATVAGVIE